MKPFVFKLQTSLDVKLNKEDRQKEMLREATKAYRKNLKVLTSLKRRLFEIQDILRGKQTEKIDIIDIKNCLDFIPVLNERIKQQELVTEEFRQVMEETRRILVEIMRDRKVLEKLKMRHYQEYMGECLREEQKQIDEMATIGYFHKDSAV